NWWGPSKCFYTKNLYRIKYGEQYSNDLEKHFFGEIDRKGAEAVNYFANFSHSSPNENHFYNFINFLSTQRMRTPKGLGYFELLTDIKSRNNLLLELKKLQNLFGAIWVESQWCIADASQSNTKFIISDHPVTTYNLACFPGSLYCQKYNDPDIRCLGTHTLFPLNLNKILILTNLGWFRNPYQNPLKYRENPIYLRNTFFNFLDIQVGRRLSDLEVTQINYIIKKRAFKYIGAAEKDWLYPEQRLKNIFWKNFGKEFLLMPEPRSTPIRSGPLIRYRNGSVDAFDEYGRKPSENGYDNHILRDEEIKAFNSFRGEYARKFGPTYRGLFGEWGKTEHTDSDETHKANIKLPRYRK
ncbi:TPA: DUF4238 domain-containing protein, partial [Legionella pneumophila]|nr:DUF4238 domain-containing protein [Legionella pneumophila]